MLRCFFWPLAFLLLSLLLRSFRFDVAPSFPATYVESGVNGSFERAGFPNLDPNGQPDTTAVILNWSRFPNVVKIASLLCGPSLENTIHTVFVWNNSPNQISEAVCLFVFTLISSQNHIFAIGLRSVYREAESVQCT